MNYVLLFSFQSTGWIVSESEVEKFPWLKIISRGGLFVPKDDWLDDFRRFEAAFIEFNGDKMDKGERVIDRFAEKLHENCWIFEFRFKICLSLEKILSLVCLEFSENQWGKKPELVHFENFECTLGLWLSL